MATHSRILAWRIPQTEEPGRLESVGSQRVGHDQISLAHNQVSVVFLVTDFWDSLLLSKK